MATINLVAARGSFSCTHDGQELLVRQGERIAADHPLVKAHAAMFEPVEPRADIEHATGAPAEKRRRRRA